LNPSSPDNFSKELQDSNILDPLDEQLPLKDLLAEYERKIIIATLKRTDGNVAKAAEKLQIHKTGLYRKIKEYRIQRAH
jgi:DNA-binding NtrC family response regulator